MLPKKVMLVDWSDYGTEGLDKKKGCRGCIRGKGKKDET